MSADQMRNFFFNFSTSHLFFILGNFSPFFFFLLLSAGMENKGPNFLNGFKKTIKVETSGGKAAGQVIRYLLCTQVPIYFNGMYVKYSAIGLAFYESKNKNKPIPKIPPWTVFSVSLYVYRRNYLYRQVVGYACMYCR